MVWLFETHTTIEAIQYSNYQIKIVPKRILYHSREQDADMKFHFDCRFLGYALLPQAHGLANSVDTASDGEQASTGPSQQHQFATPIGHATMPFAQLPHCAFVPLSSPGANVNYGEWSRGNPNTSDSQVEVQKKFLQHQIEV